MLNSGEGGQMIFEPAVIKVSKGDTIHFKAIDMSHNSATIDGMMPESAEAWSGQLNNDISVTLEEEGVYVYQCAPHIALGMIGVIQVGAPSNLDEINNNLAALETMIAVNKNRAKDYLSLVN